MNPCKSRSDDRPWWMHGWPDTPRRASITGRQLTHATISLQTPRQSIASSTHVQLSVVVKIHVTLAGAAGHPLRQHGNHPYATLRSEAHTKTLARTKQNRSLSTRSERPGSSCPSGPPRPRARPAPHGQWPRAPSRAPRPSACCASRTAGAAGPSRRWSRRRRQRR